MREEVQVHYKVWVVVAAAFARQKRKAEWRAKARPRCKRKCGPSTGRDKAKCQAQGASKVQVKVPGWCAIQRDQVRRQGASQRAKPKGKARVRSRCARLDFGIWGALYATKDCSPSNVLFI